MLKIAFYIASEGNWLDKVIAWWRRPNFWKFFTAGKFSHTEIYFSDGRSFSASPRENRCRWKVINYSPEKWVLVTLDKSFDEETIKKDCARVNGKLYDFVGIFFNFIVPIRLHIKNEYFCSELAADKVFHLERPHTYDPDKLYYKITQYFL